MAGGQLPGKDLNYLYSPSQFTKKCRPDEVVDRHLNICVKGITVVCFNINYLSSFQQLPLLVKKWDVIWVLSTYQMDKLLTYITHQILMVSDHYYLKPAVKALIIQMDIVL